ncbi:unnamed protein product, partial [marine sediment metagenome]
VYVSDDEMLVQKHTTQNEQRFGNDDLLLSMESVFKIPAPDLPQGTSPVPLSELTHLRFFTFKTGNTDWPYMMVAQDVFTTYKSLGALSTRTAAKSAAEDILKEFDDDSTE